MGQLSQYGGCLGRSWTEQFRVSALHGGRNLDSGPAPPTVLGGILAGLTQGAEEGLICQANWIKSSSYDRPCMHQGAICKPFRTEFTWGPNVSAGRNASRLCARNTPTCPIFLCTHGFHTTQAHATPHTWGSWLPPCMGPMGLHVWGCMGGVGI